MSVTDYINQKLTFDGVWLAANFLLSFSRYNGVNFPKKDFLNHCRSILEKNSYIFFNNQHSENNDISSSLNDKIQLIETCLKPLVRKEIIIFNENNLNIININELENFFGNNGLNYSLNFLIRYFRDVMMSFGIYDDIIDSFQNSQIDTYSSFKKNKKNELNKLFFNLGVNGDINSIKNSNRIFNKPCLYLAYNSGLFRDLNNDKSSLFYVKNLGSDNVRNSLIRNLNTYENENNNFLDVYNEIDQKINDNYDDNYNSHDDSNKKNNEILRMNNHDFSFDGHIDDNDVETVFNLLNNNDAKLSDLTNEKIKKIIRKNFNNGVKTESDLTVNNIKTEKLIELAHINSVSKIRDDLKKYKNDKSKIKEILKISSCSGNCICLPFNFHKLLDEEFIKIDFENEKFCLKNNELENEIKIFGFTKDNKIEHKKICEIQKFIDEYNKIIK